MQRYKRDILQVIEEKSIMGMRILWKGKPFLPAYLVSNKKMLGWLVVEAFLLYYEDFQFMVYSKAYTIVLVLYLLYSAAQGLSLSYYLTEKGPVIKKGRSCYLLNWEDLLKEEYSAYGKPIERLLGCQTIEFTRNYTHSLKKDEWKQKARFWSIKDYKKVDRIVQNYVN